MRYLLILIAVIFVCFGCGEKSSRDVYVDTWEKYIDSCGYYFEKWQCCFNNKEFEKARVFGDKQSIFVDSSKKYYKLMYPNGNPADKRAEAKKPYCNCN